jgi:hypothetical protein
MPGQVAARPPVAEGAAVRFRWEMVRRPVSRTVTTRRARNRGEVGRSKTWVQEQREEGPGFHPGSFASRSPVLERFTLELRTRIILTRSVRSGPTAFPSLARRVSMSGMSIELCAKHA